MLTNCAMVNALKTTTGSNLGLDPRFVTKRRNYFDTQELESVKIDRNRLMLYPSLGAEATNAKKNHAFNVVCAAFTAKRRIDIEDGIIVAASYLKCATQISSALKDVVS